MKAYSVHWKTEALVQDDKDKRGTTIVLADSVIKAVVRFELVAGDKVVDSVYLESDEVLIDHS
jgi:hypothetical protein